MLEALLDRYLPGVEVWAYGSRVSGRGHGASDLDLVLRAPGLRPIPLRELAAFTETLRDSKFLFWWMRMTGHACPRCFTRRSSESMSVLSDGGTH